MLQELVMLRKPASAWAQSVCMIDYAITRVGSNIVEEEVHRLFCGIEGFGLAGSNGAERHK